MKKLLLFGLMLLILIVPVMSITEFNLTNTAGLCDQFAGTECNVTANKVLEDAEAFIVRDFNPLRVSAAVTVQFRNGTSISPGVPLQVFDTVFRGNGIFGTSGSPTSSSFTSKEAGDITLDSTVQLLENITIRARGSNGHQFPVGSDGGPGGEISYNTTFEIPIGVTILSRGGDSCNAIGSTCENHGGGSGKQVTIITTADVTGNIISEGGDAKTPESGFFNAGGSGGIVNVTANNLFGYVASLGKPRVGSNFPGGTCQANGQSREINLFITNAIDVVSINSTAFCGSSGSPDKVGFINAASITVENLDSDSTSLVMTSTGSITIGEIHTDDIADNGANLNHVINISGAGTMSLNGDILARDINIDASSLNLNTSVLGYVLGDVHIESTVDTTFQSNLTLAGDNFEIFNFGTTNQDISYLKIGVPENITFNYTALDLGVLLFDQVLSPTNLLFEWQFNLSKDVEFEFVTNLDLNLMGNFTPPPPPQINITDFTTIFNATNINGTFINTSVNTTIPALVLNQSFTQGSFISQIFDATQFSQWNNFTWWQELNYGEPLPDNQTTETGDFIRPASMTQNELLYHLEESSGLALDSSGNGLNATVSGPTRQVQGIFNFAYDFTPGDFLRSNRTQNFTRSVVTIEAWLNSDAYLQDAVFITAQPILTQTLEIQPNATEAKDAWINELTPTINHGTNTSLQISNRESQQRSGLLEFNISAIPDNATILSAILSINVTSVPGTPFNATIQRLVQNWTEAGVTWNTRDGVIAWTTAGGTFNDTIEDNQLVNETRIFNFDITNLVNQWYLEIFDNEGLIIKNLVTVGGSPQTFLFDSSDAAGAISSKPKLTITFDIMADANSIGYGNASNNYILSIIENNTEQFCFSADNVVKLGQFQHIAGRLNGTAVQVFVDGLPSGSPCPFSGLTDPNDEDLLFGLGYDGRMDEIAIHNRSLSNQEILDHYLRGILNLDLFVRSCDDGACAGESFTEVTDPSTAILNVSNNQYFQYQFNFTSLNGTFSPQIFNTTINLIPTAEPIPSVTNFTIFTRSQDLNLSINVFNATVNGTFFNTSNGVIVTDIDGNNSALINITVESFNYLTGQFNDVDTIIQNFTAVLSPIIFVASPNNDTEVGVGIPTVDVNFSAVVNMTVCEVISDPNVTHSTGINITSGVNTTLFLNISLLNEGDNLWHLECNDTLSNTFNTEDVNIYLDSILPTINTTFIDDLLVFNSNVTGTFNFTDNFLFSYEIKLNNNQTLANDSNLNVTTVSVPINFNPEDFSLPIGRSFLNLTVSDGHTAEEIPEWDYDINYLTKSIVYNFPHQGTDGWIKITGTNGFDVASSLNTEKKKDRYSFIYNRHWFEKVANGLDMTFKVESSENIVMSQRPDFPGWMIIPKLNKWLDFNTLSSNEGYTVNRIDEYAVEVTVHNVTDDDVIFNSIGELNTITQIFNFYNVNMTTTFNSVVNAGDAFVNNLSVDFGTLLFNISGLAPMALLEFNGTNFTATNLSFTVNDANFTQAFPLNNSFNGVIPHRWHFNLSNLTNGFISTPFVNQTFIPIIVAVCNATITNPILNLSYFDEISNAPITATNAYNLAITDGLRTTNLLDFFSGNQTNSICTNLDPITAPFNWELTGSFTLSSPGFVTRVIDFPQPTAIPLSNNPTTNQSLFLIAINQSNTVVFTWLTNDYEAIDGTMRIFRCNTDGTKSLVESVPVISGTTASNNPNIELLTVSYSYDIVIGSNIFTDDQSFTRCHVETTSERTFFVNTAEDLLSPFLGLGSIICDLSKTGNNTVTHSWGTNPQQAGYVSGCVKVERRSIGGNVEIFNNCSIEPEGFLRVLQLPVSNNDFVVTARMEQNNQTFGCYDTVTFSANDNTGGRFGVSGLLAVFLIVVSVVLLYSGRPEISLLVAGAVIVGTWIIGILNFDWLTMVIGVTFLILIAVIGRHTRKD